MGALLLLCQMVLGWVSFFLGMAYAGIIAFYYYGWKLAGKQGTPVNGSHGRVKVSVIVPARNEEANIATCLNSLLAQDYPRQYLEIIVVDDESEDNTSNLVQSFIEKNDFIKLVRLSPDNAVTAHKKRAIATGIGLASGQLIVCTDADCTHKSKWLSVLVAAYNGGENKFIAAPVVYETGKTLLSIFQTLDFMTLQGITAASVATNFHTMCNGANVAYDRAAFYEVKGFEGIDNLPTGDDMLLMHKIYKRFPGAISYLLNADAIVTTPPAHGLFAFFQQRIRWASKAAYYDDKRIFRVLLLVYLFNFWLLFLAVAGIFLLKAWFLLLILLGLKIWTEGLFLVPVASFYKQQKLLWWFPFLQPFHILYTLSAGWLGRFGSYKWKGRTIEKPSNLQGL